MKLRLTLILQVRFLPWGRLDEKRGILKEATFFDVHPIHIRNVVEDVLITEDSRVHFYNTGNLLSDSLLYLIDSLRSIILPSKEKN